MTVDVEQRHKIRWEAHYGDRIVKCHAQRPRNLLEMFERSCRDRADAEAIADGETRLTYRQLGAAVAACACGLRNLGVQAGDRAALLLGNRAEFAIALFALLRVGAIAVPLNIREQKPELLSVLGRCGARFLFHEAELAERLPERDRLPALEHRIAVGGQADGSIPFETLRELPASNEAHEASEEEVAVLLYTSGTTGKPKGAMLTHLALVTTVLHYRDCWKIGPEDRALMAVPASHVTGLAAILLTTIGTGGAVILMRGFSAAGFMALAAAERMTYTLMVPAMYNLCLLRTDFRSHDLSAWRVGGYGGAPMPPATIAALAEVLPGLQLVNAYGSTETASPATLTPLGEGRSRADTVGRPLACTEIRIMDEAGREMPPGETGEIWVGGAQVSPGYWADPEATGDAFVAGFWRSGDIGSMGADGYLRVLDRKKDMVNRAGFKVYPAEVEAVLVQHPMILEAAIIGFPDPVLGEKTHAHIVATDPVLTPETILDYCRAELSDYKIPDRITIRTEPLPRNANGKVMKRALPVDP